MRSRVDLESLDREAKSRPSCRVDEEIGFPDYRFVRKWIERHPPAPLTLRQVDPLIRELSQYRELVSQLTSSPSSTESP